MLEEPVHCICISMNLREEFQDKASLASDTCYGIKIERGGNEKE